MSLEAATNLVIAAEEGRYGALARMGIQIDSTATKEQALAAIQTQVAGQADTFANTDLGKIETTKIKIDEFTESLGAQLGKYKEIIALLPGVNAAYSSLAAIVGGMGGFGALAGVAAPIAAVAGLGTLGYAYSQGSIGTTTANTLGNEFFLHAFQVANFLTPGNAFDVNKYKEQIKQNEAGSLINQSLLGPGEDQSVVWDRLHDLTGTITGEMSTKDLIDYVVQKANQANETVNQYITSLARKNADYVQDPLTGVLMPRTDYYRTAVTRGGPAGLMPSGFTSPLAAGPPPQSTSPFGIGGLDWWQSHFGPMGQYGTGPGGGRQYQTYRAGGSGAVANDISGQVAMGGGVRPVLTDDQQEAQHHAAVAKALKDENAGYVDLASGIRTAASAQAFFKATQDGILQSEKQYTGQIGEYTSQLNALDNAYELINGKKKDGIALTKQETDFINGYADAHERLAGGVDDATESLGFQAEQYAENMKKGDELNKSIQDQTDSVSDLVDVITDLITNLYGIPPTVKTNFDMEGLAAANSATYTLSHGLDALDGRKVTYTVAGTYSTQGTGSGGFDVGAGGDLGSIGGGAGQGPRDPGGGTDPFGSATGAGFRLGGVIRAARHGRYIGGPYTLVDEDGPELLVGGQGGMVIPASATRAKLQAMGGGGDLHFYAPVTVVANDPAAFGRQMRSRAVSGSRR
jgi:hypothetical protein